MLDYCTAVATSPDPDDPDAALREAESTKTKSGAVDDPYTVFPREARTERLAVLLRQERGVENIVRTRTWEMVRQRCGDDSASWEDALDRWRKTRKPTRDVP